MDGRLSQSRDEEGVREVSQPSSPRLVSDETPVSDSRRGGHECTYASMPQDNRIRLGVRHSERVSPEGPEPMCVRISLSPLLQRRRWTRQGGSTRPARGPWSLNFYSRGRIYHPRGRLGAGAPEGVPISRCSSLLWSASIPAGPSPSDPSKQGERSDHEIHSTHFLTTIALGISSDAPHIYRGLPPCPNTNGPEPNNPYVNRPSPPATSCRRCTSLGSQSPSPTSITDPGALVSPVHESGGCSLVHTCCPAVRG